MTKLVTFLTGIISFLVFGYCFLSETTQFEKSKYENSQSTDINTQVDTSETISQGSGGPTKQYSKEAQEYFKEIALKNEFAGDRSTAYVWDTDMKIFVEGEKPESLMLELQKIVGELNGIINTIDIKIVSSKSQSNYVIFFGSQYDFTNNYSLNDPQYVSSNLGYFEVYASSGVMYVDLLNTNEVEQRHLLREELTQSLGLFNDSWDYPESIFYQGWTTTTEYAPIDRELIDMLYNN